MSLKLISINVERDKHLGRVIPFIQGERPDVLCVQELNQKDMHLFINAMKSVSHFFSPMLRFTSEEGPATLGLGIFSRYPVRDFSEYVYAGSRDDIPLLSHDLVESDIESPANSVLAIAEIERHTAVFRIANTHFTWSPKGETTNRQRQDIRSLLDVTKSLGEVILCGDFNAPRGGEIFSFLSDHYHDAIPPRYKTSIDVSLHRSGKDRPEELADKMVDGLFTSAGYRASGVRLESGISDHCAVVASVHLAGTRRFFNISRFLR